MDYELVNRKDMKYSKMMEIISNVWSDFNENYTRNIVLYDEKEEVKDYYE